MPEVQTKTLNATGLMPSLTVDNLQRSLDFFTGLGFEVEDRWEDNGQLLGVMLKAGTVQLGLSQDDGKNERNAAHDRGTARARAPCCTQGLDHGRRRLAHRQCGARH